MTRGFALAAALLALTLAAAFAPCAAAQQLTTPATPPLPCPAQPSAGPTSTPPAVPASQSSSSQTPPTEAWHCVSVQFQYDFGKTPPCAGTNPKHPCVAQFAIYDTSNGTGKRHRTFLFNVPLPAKTSGVEPVSGQSPKQIDFMLGWHKLGVGALDDTGKDSHMKFCDSCATWIDVQASSSTTPSTPVPGTSDAPPGTTPSPTPPPHP